MKESDYHERSGFTLVELLVVIGIIAILVSLLLPAVNATREAARTSSCRNNIRQVAHAIINYETSFGRLPSAGLVRENRRPDLALGAFIPNRGQMISWAVLILPYIEEENLYERFDLTRSILEQDGNPQEEFVTIYQCPSGIAAGQKFAHESRGETVMFSKSNYAAFVSPFHTDLMNIYPGALGGGRWLNDSFKTRVGQKISAVYDGLSKTLLLSEVRIREDESDQRGVWALPWTGSSLLAADAHDDPDSSGAYNPWELTYRSTQTPNHLDENVDMLYQCDSPEIAREENMPCGEWDRGESQMHYLSAAPRSNHPGGVMVANMDGSVMLIADSVDARTFALMISSIDGEQSELD